VDAGAGKRCARLDGFGAGQCEDRGGSVATGRCGLSGERVELEELRQRVANLLKLATLEKETIRCGAPHDRRSIRSDDRPRGGMRRAFEMADRVARPIRLY